MQRDMDIARRILLEVEEFPFHGERMFSPESTTLANVPDNIVSYHVMLLHEAGLLKGIDMSSMDGLKWVPTRLTWAGHEFLDAARDDGRWTKAKGTIREKAGTVAFEVLKELLAQLAKASLGLPS